MRILFLTQVLPYPLDAGPKIRAYYTLRHLARQHEIVLLSFRRQTDPPEAIAKLSELCRSAYVVPIHRSTFADAWHGLVSLLSGEPFLIARDRNTEMEQAVRWVIKNEGPFDAIHADQLWMAPYAAFARRQLPNPSKVRTILDQHNAVYQIPKRMAQGERNYFKREILRLESRKLVKYEIRTCAECDHVVFVSEQDQSALREHGLGTSRPSCQTVIPISVDPVRERTPMERAAPPRVTFMGGLHWPPNAEGAEWFTKQVWHLIRTSVPGAVFTLIGKLPSGSRIKPRESIEVTGYLNNPDTFLENTRVFVVPLQSGGGMRVKILDAWSRSLPVVSTTIGAEGLRAHHGKNILLADTPGEFASAVSSLLLNSRLAASIASEGRNTVETYYDWKQVYCLWDKVYG